MRIAPSVAPPELESRDSTVPLTSKILSGVAVPTPTLPPLGCSEILCATLDE